MRFWCSVSDRCSGKIGEGKVPPAQLQLCLRSLFGTKGPCHMCHDWWGCTRIVKAYLHETPEGEPMLTCRFVLPLFVLHAPQPNTCQTDILQHNQNQFISPGMIHHIISGLWTLLPTYLSPSCVIFEWICLKKDHDAQNIWARHLSLIFVSSLYHSELLMTNDFLLRRNHIIILEYEEYFKESNNGTLRWSFWRSHLQLCSILRASDEPSEFGLIWRTMKWMCCSIDWIMRLCASESSPNLPPLSPSQRHHPPTLPSSLMELIYA